ncbi:MAG: response regulator transcription factor [Anaerolineae bacterium]|nr:response regulator transcription factor [Anaerolineae bacterium]
MKDRHDPGGKITILIIDDHPILRQGLRKLLELEGDFEVMAEAGTGQEGIACAPHYAPDVILLDINLPDLNGLQVAQHLRNAQLDSAIVLLTAYDDPTQEYYAMQAGASAYCPKDIQPEALFQIIRWVAQGSYVVGGKVYNEHDVHAWIAQHGRAALGPAGELSRPDALSPGGLSSREMQVLRAVTRGLSNKEIAQELGISYQTVRNHVTSILGKLNLEGRTQAALFAIQRGWVRAGDRVAGSAADRTSGENGAGSGDSGNNGHTGHTDRDHTSGNR